MHSPLPRPSRRIDHGSPDAAQRSTTRVKVSMLETLADEFDKTAPTIVTLTARTWRTPITAPSASCVELLLETPSRGKASGDDLGPMGFADHHGHPDRSADRGSP